MGISPTDQLPPSNIVVDKAALRRRCPGTVIDFGSSSPVLHCRPAFCGCWSKWGVGQCDPWEVPASHGRISDDSDKRGDWRQSLLRGIRSSGLFGKTKTYKVRPVKSDQMRSIWHSKNCTCCPVSRVLFLCNFIFLSTSKSTFFQIFRTQNLYANATSNCQATTNSHDQIEIEIYTFYFFLAGPNFMVLNAKNSPAPARSALVLSASWGQKYK